MLAAPLVLRGVTVIDVQTGTRLPQQAVVIVGNRIQSVEPAGQARVSKGAAGKVADVVLLDADPLADIWNTTKIRAVVANGRYYDRVALDGLLIQAEQAAVRQ